MILVLPVVFETEKLQMEQQQQLQQRQVSTRSGLRASDAGLRSGLFNLLKLYSVLTHFFLFQILLGPNTGLSGGMPGALPPLPGKI